MLSNKEKIGCLLKLFAWEFVTAAEKRDDAKRKQAALSSLLADAQWESERVATCDKSRSLGGAGTDRARLCMPSAALGGEDVLRGLAARVALVMNKCVRAGGVVESYRHWSRAQCAHLFNVAAHT
jgi:hypothetical protein